MSSFVMQVTVDHSCRGALEFVLTSPHNTNSTLATTRKYDKYICYTFGLHAYLTHPPHSPSHSSHHTCTSHTHPHTCTSHTQPHTLITLTRTLHTRTLTHAPSCLIVHTPTYPPSYTSFTLLPYTSPTHPYTHTHCTPPHIVWKNPPSKPKNINV